MYSLTQKLFMCLHESWRKTGAGEKLQVSVNAIANTLKNVFLCKTVFMRFHEPHCSRKWDNLRTLVKNTPGLCSLVADIKIENQIVVASKTCTFSSILCVNGSLDMKGLFYSVSFYCVCSSFYIKLVQASFDKRALSIDVLTHHFDGS